MCVLSLPYTYKHYQGHQEEAACAINTHVVEHRSTFIKQCCCWNNVNLEVWRQQEQREHVLVIPWQRLPSLALVCEVTNQQNLYGPQNVHGSSKCGPKIKAEPHGSPKLWTQ